VLELVAALSGCGGAGGQGTGHLSREQKRIAHVICKVAEAKKASQKVRLAAFEAALVESNMRNLNYGDASSLGVFQQQKGWGSPAERMDPEKATAKFIAAAKKIESKRVGAGRLAADVQRPLESLRGRYAHKEGQAKALIKKYC
jgi:hypothetical protein